MTVARTQNSSAESYEQRRDRASREMGSYLLRGWAMSNDVCPVASCGCPLMRSRTNESICVLCGPVDYQGTAAVSALVSTDDIERQRTLLRERERVEREQERHLVHDPSISSQLAPVGVMSVEPAATRGNRASRLLSQKMLQGWTLLGDVCPTCEEIPLVRNPSQQAYCVICERYFRRGSTSEESWVPAAAASPLPQQITLPHEISPVVTLLPSHSNPSTVSVLSTRLSPIPDVLTQSQSVVLSQIQFYSQQLASASNPTSARDNAGVIRELAQCLEALRKA